MGFGVSKVSSGGIGGGERVKEKWKRKESERFIKKKEEKENG